MDIFKFDAELYEQVLKEENWELGKAEGLAEGLADGKILNLIELTCRKLTRGKSVETIADELEEDPEKIRKICAIAADFAPEYDARKILEEYL